MMILNFAGKNDPQLDIGMTNEVDDIISDDDIPLAQYLQKSNSNNVQKKMNKNDLKWDVKDIEFVNTECHVHFSDPPGPITPLAYLKKFVDDAMIENIVLQTNLYSCQKRGSSINTNKA